jgi:hypothetical protein
MTNLQHAVDFDTDTDDGIPIENLVILTEEEMLLKGLDLIGWNTSRVEKWKSETALEHYRGMYGVNPVVTAQLCEDLQRTEVGDARIGKMDVEKLHWALHFLYRYPSEIESSNTWNKCANTIRESHWFYTAKIRALKVTKIRWPRSGFWKDDDIWVLSVDGTHLLVLEPGDSDIPKDPSYFSFKHHAAGFNYEVGVCLFESKCIWLNGPNKAGEYNDAKMFTDGGLKDKLALAGKKGIGDDGYRGFPNQISTANGLDSEDVRVYKVRSRQRHEVFNGKLKQFGVLSERFRCKNNANDQFTAAEKLQMCFEAVVVLVQYKMDMGEPLFDI